MTTLGQSNNNASLSKIYFVLDRLVYLFVYIIYCLLFVFIPSFVSCSSNPKIQVANMGNTLDSMYMMMTKNVDILVSDSGITKYRMNSPVWYIYDREDKKEWYFPDGLRLTSIDTTPSNKYFLKADTAIYYIDKNKWELIGHVELLGQNQSKLFTPHLFWDKTQRKIYSDDTTYFVTEGRELRGDKFTAMDDLSNYSIFNNSGSFELNESSSTSDSIPLDSMTSNVKSISK